MDPYQSAHQGKSREEEVRFYQGLAAPALASQDSRRRLFPHEPIGPTKNLKEEICVRHALQVQESW